LVKSIRVSGFTSCQLGTGFISPGGKVFSGDSIGSISRLGLSWLDELSNLEYYFT